MILQAQGQATKGKGGRANRRREKLGHVPVFDVPLTEIVPSPENDEIYRPVDPGDKEILALAESIREFGVKVPLVITEDNYILSGHRRHAAARLAGLTSVPCQHEPIRRTDDHDGFVRLLREYNRQREKTFDERLREELVSTNRDDAYAALLSQRREKSKVSVPALEIVGYQTRCRISDAKTPFLDAVRTILDTNRDYWPLSDRQVHYYLLNEPPLIHAKKPESTYQNNLKSYKALTDLLTRARLEQRIAWEAIADPTRSVSDWRVFPSATSFIRGELDGFLVGYYRDLMQSQPNHVEIVAEKLTVKSIIRPIAGEFTIPLTIGRGYCSIEPRYKMAQRYRKSGKEKLIVLILSDFDCDGEEIAQSFARSMRDDFGVVDIHPVKVGLTFDQVQRFNLPTGLMAKKSSANYAKFVRQYGATCWELEALPPATLQTLLDEVIRSVIDIDAYNREVDAERRDAADLSAMRKTAQKTLGNTNFEKLQ